MHREVKRPVGFALDRDVVKITNAAVSRGRGMDPFHQVALLLLPLHRDSQVEARKHRSRPRLHVVDQRAGCLDGKHATGGDARVTDHVGTGPSHAHRPDLAHAVDVANRVSQLLLGAGRSSVDQDVARAPRQQARRSRDDRRHQQRRHRVGPGQPHPHSDQPGDHAQRRQHVGQAVRRVGEHGLAGCEPADPAQDPGPSGLDQERGDQQTECVAGWIDDGAALGQPADRLESDERGGDQKQDALGERGQVFGPAVAVGMLGVGRLVGCADGGEGESAGREVQE